MINKSISVQFILLCLDDPSYEISHDYLLFSMDGGELFNQIVRRGSFGEKDASKIIKQVLEGIHYLHKLGVAHRDLKVILFFNSLKFSSRKIYSAARRMIEL